MVKLLTWLLLFVVPSTVFATDSLYIEVDREKVQLGKAINARIIARDLPDDISGLDISPLHNVFGVVINESSTTTGDNGSTIQQLNVSLYPRNLGSTHIPGLTLSGATSRPVKITTTHARAPGAKISFSAMPNAFKGWQRQQHIVSARVVTPDKFASLSIDDIELPGIVSATLPVHRSVDEKGNIVLVSGWILSSYKPGDINLLLPAVNYHLHGKVQRKFYPAPVRLSSQPLPSYIPPNMPVGLLGVSSITDKPGALFVTPEFNWTIRITGIDSRLGSTPSVENQLQQVSSPLFGPASYKNIALRTHNLNDSTLQITVPVSMPGIGYYTLPALNIRYFEPHSGRLRTVSHQPDPVLVLNRWLIAGAGIILFVALLFVGRNITRRIQHWRSCRRLLKHNLESILQAESPRELVKLLRDYAGIRGWQENISLGHWRRYWSELYGEDAISCLDELSGYCYGKVDYTAGQQQTLNTSLYAMLSHQRHSVCRLFQLHKL